jgi:ABC-2 type transport system ATP-binding protein
MPVVEVTQISKSFGPVKAVDEVSFSVEKGEIFALLGPNGAGKTTTIRIMLDIYRPDQGKIAIFGGPMTEAKKDRIGYMPEERGLYQDLPLERVLVYLASLKGISAGQARQQVSVYLERFDLEAYKLKKVKELSKGMQQKAQIIATLLHQPDLVIIDEPFSGLDPVNTQVVKDLLLELHSQEVTIIMSTHQMHQVEELCDRILLINQGKVMLYGDLEQIRRQYAGNAVLVRTEKPLPVGLPGVMHLADHNSASRLTLSPGVSPQDVLRRLVDLDIPLEQFEIAVPTLDEIFIRVVKGGMEQE